MTVVVDLAARSYYFALGMCLCVIELMTWAARRPLERATGAGSGCMLPSASVPPGRRPPSVPVARCHGVFSCRLQVLGDGRSSFSTHPSGAKAQRRLSMRGPQSGIAAASTREVYIHTCSIQQNTSIVSGHRGQMALF